MITRRGLTLLEVLLATVLLAILAAACAPMLQQSLAVLHAEGSEDGAATTQGVHPGVERTRLAELADAIMEDPEEFGIDLQTLTTTTIAWMEHSNHPPARLARLNQFSEGEESQGAWLVLSCNDWHIHRYLPPPPPPDEAEGPPRSFKERGDS